MNKYFNALIITVLIFTLTACGKAEQTIEQPNQTKQNFSDTTTALKTNDFKETIYDSDYEIPKHYSLSIEEMLANKTVEKTLTYIKNRDKKGLKNEFSKYALNNIDNIDAEIDELFKIFDDQIKDYEPGSPSTEKYNHYGKIKEYKFETYNKVYVGNEVYFMWIRKTQIDDENSEKIGIDRIIIESMSNSEKEIDDKTAPGIFILI